MNEFDVEELTAQVGNKRQNRLSLDNRFRGDIVDKFRMRRSGRKEQKEKN